MKYNNLNLLYSTFTLFLMCWLMLSMPLGLAEINYQNIIPQNNSVQSSDVNISSDLNETTGEKIDSVDLYMDGVLTDTISNINEDVVNVLFTVLGLTDGSYDWFFRSTLKNGTVENSTTYNFEVDSSYDNPENHNGVGQNSNLYNFSDDNTEYRVWVYVNFDEWLDENNLTLVKNKTKIKDDVVVKIKQKYVGSEEKFKLKSKDSNILLMSMTGKEILKMLSDSKKEKVKADDSKDKDLASIIEVHKEPIFDVQANPNKGDARRVMKADKASNTVIDGTSSKINGSTIRIAVVDSGYDVNNSNVSTHVNDSLSVDYCAIDDGPCDGTDSVPEDPLGHGTEVSSLVASEDEELSLLPDAEIVHFKACNSDGTCSGSSLLASLDHINWYSESQGYDIDGVLFAVSDNGDYNSSNCPTWFDSVLTSLHEQNIPVVASVANHGGNGMAYPACKNIVVRAGSTDFNTTSVSNYSAGVNQNDLDVWYADGKVKSISLNGFIVQEGTSMSAPQVLSAFMFAKELSEIDPNTDVNNDGYSDYDFNKDGNVTIEDTLLVLNATSDETNNGSKHKKINIKKMVNWLLHKPAFTPGNGRIFNSNGEIRFSNTIASTMSEETIDECVNLSTNFISVNETTCNNLAGSEANVTMNDLPDYSSDPWILKNGELCSLFFCPNQDYDSDTNTLKFLSKSFSNYTTNGSVNFTVNTNIPDDNNYYDVWVHINYSEFLMEDNVTLEKNKSKIRDDVVVKVKTKFADSDEKFKLKSKDAPGLVFVKMKGKDANKLQEDADLEKIKDKAVKDKDLSSIQLVEIEPSGFSQDASPVVGEAKTNMRGGKANLERPDGAENLTGAGYTIVVIDSGLEISDSNFTDRYLGGYDYCASDGAPCSGTDATPDEKNTHGSFVSSLVAANDPNLALLPEANLYVFSACNSAGGCGASSMLAGLDHSNWLIEIGNTENITAIILAISDSGNYTNETCPTWFDSTLQSLKETYNVPIIVSAGNDGLNENLNYPACSPYVYPAGATDNSDFNAKSYSNGKNIVSEDGFEIFYADGNVKALCIGSDYCIKDGTSMAAPLVASAFVFVEQLRDLDPDHDDDDDGLDDYDVNGDGAFNVTDAEYVLRLTGTQVGNSPHKKVNAWGVVNYFQNKPAVIMNEDRTLNGNGEIQFPNGTIGDNSTNEQNVVDCFVLNNSLIYLNDSDSSCNTTYADLTSNLTMNKRTEDTKPMIMKNGYTCSAFDECKNIVFDDTNDQLNWTAYGFSNYTTENATFSLHAKPAGKNKEEVRGDKVNRKQEALTNLTGAGYSICVIDSGVNYSVGDLGGGWGAVVIDGYDYCADDNCTSEDTDPVDEGNHGTAVAAVVSSQGYGIAPDASILALKVTDSSGNVGAEAVVGAIDWCNNWSDYYNISSIVISLGDTGLYNSTNPCPEWWEPSLNESESLGILVTASTGNDGNVKAINYPSCQNTVVAVSGTATNETEHYNANTRDSNSNFYNEDYRSIFAPYEVNITDSTAGLSIFQGTSMSAPHVAAAKVLIDQFLNLSGQDPVYYDMDDDSDWDNDDVYAILNLTGHVVGSGKVKIDIRNAINYLRSADTGEPALLPEENKLFNKEGIIQFILNTLSTNFTLTEEIVESCVVVKRNTVFINSSNSICDPLINSTANLTMYSLTNGVRPMIMKDGYTASLFDEINSVRVDGTSLTFQTYSFSNYSTENVTFEFSGKKATDHKKEIRADKVHDGVWNLTENVTGAGYSICIIDSGINYSEADLGGSLGAVVIDGYDYCADDNCTSVDGDPLDLFGHGTPVGAIASSQQGYGIAPDAKLIAMKVADADGDITPEGVVASIDWCNNWSSYYNISSIVISISSTELFNDTNLCEDWWQPSLNESESLGILVASANGNGGNAQAVSYPACENTVFGVGGTDTNLTEIYNGNTINGSSNYNMEEYRQIFAPYEVNITGSGTGLSIFQGTSMSAPHVASAKVLIDQFLNLSGVANTYYDQDSDADWDLDDVYIILNKTGHKVGNGKNTKIDIRNAINYLSSHLDSGRPAINPEENKIFNFEGEIQYTGTALSDNFTLTEDVAEDCATIQNNFVDVNDEYSNCSTLRDTNANITMENIEYVSDDEITLFRDGQICSLFFCPDQAYDNVTDQFSFSVTSFSNYTTNGSVFNFTVDEVQNLTAVTLNTSTGNNYTSEDLTAYPTPYNSSQEYLYEWVNDGVIEYTQTGDSFDTLDSSLTSIGETWYANVTPYSNGTAYDISSLNYVSNFSITDYDGTMGGIQFSPSGDKMYLIGSNNDAINQFDLSTEWDVTTASFVSNYTVSSDDSLIPNGLYLKADGTKMYVSDHGKDAVFEYSLSNPYDLSTISFVQNISVASCSVNSRDVSFSNDGLKMYIVDVAGDDFVCEFNLSTAWDISTIIYNSNITVFGVVPAGIDWNDDGTEMFLVSWGYEQFMKYNLTTAWDITTATNTQNYTLPVGAHNGYILGKGGLKHYYLESGTNFVMEYEVSVIEGNTVQSNDLEVLGETGTVLLNSTTGENSTADNLVANLVGWSSEWTSYYYEWFLGGVLTLFGYDVSTLNSGNTSTGDVWSVNVTAQSSTAYDISNLNTVYSMDISSYDLGGSDIKFNSDGTYMYFLGTDNDAVHQFELSTAWDISTASFVQNFSCLSDGCSNPQDMYFTDDGLKMYFDNAGSDEVFEYNLSTAWNVSTAVYVQEVSLVTLGAPNTRAMTFNDDGTIMYLADLIGDDHIFQYALSTAWNVTTATYTNNMSDTTDAVSPTSIIFLDNGSTMILVGFGNEVLAKYSLSEAWNVSTASYVESGDLGYTSQSFVFGKDGVKGYSVDAINELLYEHDIGLTETVASNDLTILSGVGNITLNSSTGENSTVDDLTATLSDFATGWDSYLYEWYKDGTMSYSELINDTSSVLDSSYTTPDEVWYANVTPYYGTSYDITTTAYHQNFDAGAGNPTSVEFNYDGTQMVYVNNNAERIVIYNLTTAWDVSTAVFDKNFDLPSGNNYQGISYNNDYTSVYVIESLNLEQVFEYELDSEVNTANLSINDSASSSRDVDFSSDGDYMYILNNSDGIYAYSLSTNWDITTATLTSDFFDLSGYDTEGVFFTDDGLSMFVVGINNDTVYEFELSTAWNVTTASYTGNSVAAQSSAPKGLTFSTTGHKMYTTDTGTDRIYEYNLTTLTEGTTVQSNSITINDGVGTVSLNSTTVNNYSTEDLTATLSDFATGWTDYQYDWYKNDTLSYTELSNETSSVLDYAYTSVGEVWYVNVTAKSLESNFDLSVATYVQSLNTSSYETSLRGFHFADSGKKLYFIGLNNDTVYQFDLTDGYNLSTASYVRGVDIFALTGEYAPTDITLSPDGTKMYAVGNGLDELYQWDLSTAFNISTYSNLVNISLFVGGIRQFEFHPDGDRFWYNDYDGGVYEYNMSTAWDITTATHIANYTILASIESIDFNNDGTKVFMAEDTGDTIMEFELSEAYNLSTATNTVNVTFAEESNPKGIVFSTDGSKFFVGGNDEGGQISEYNLGTTTTSTTVQSNSITIIEEANITSLTLNASSTLNRTSDDLIAHVNVTVADAQIFYEWFRDGTSIYTYLGNTTDGNTFSSAFTGVDETWYVKAKPIVVENSFDISTATLQGNVSFAAYETNPRAVAFNNDGTKMVMVGTNSDKIYQYNLGTAFDITTATLVANISTYSGLPAGIEFSIDGSKMYVLNNGFDIITEYELSENFNITTATPVYNMTLIAGQTRDHEFNSDGTKLFYAVDSSFDIIAEYDLETAWDISTASYVQNISVQNLDGNPQGMTFNDDGTLMYFAGNVNNKIYEFALTDAYNISTATNTQNITLGEDSTFKGIEFNSIGTKFYLVGSENDALFEYEIGTTISEGSYITSNNITIDNYPLYVEYLEPTEVNGSTVSQDYINVTVNAFDYDVIDNITVYLYNSSLSLINSSIDFGNTKNETYTATFEGLTDGLYYFNATAQSPANDTNSTATWYVTLDLTAPNITLLTPANATETVNTSINFTANITDNYNLSNGTLHIYNETGLYNQTNIDLSGVEQVVGIVVALVDGVYEWFFTAFDFLGNEKTYSDNGNFTITQDDTPPTFNVTPTNQTVPYLTDVSYQVNASDNVVGFDSFAIDDTTNFSVNATSGLITNNTILGVGVYPVNITINDTLGNENSTLISFNITQIAGNITLTVNNSADNTTLETGTTIDLNCSYETGEVNATLYNNGSSLATGQVDLGSSVTFTTLGIYNVSCSIPESQNYTAETEWYLVNVSDTTNPGIVLVSPTNATETVNTSINFTANVTDNYNLSNATLYVYNSTDDLVNQTTVDITGTQSLVGIVVSLIDGIYNWFFDVFDSSGNSNSTVNWTLTQDDTEPIFGAIANQSVAYLVNVTYDIDATDNLIGLDTFTINDTGNFAINSTGYITNATPLGVGVYWVNISVNDTLGNENSSIMNFNITQIAGNITLTINNSADNITIETGDTIDLNCSYETGEVNATLYNNGSSLGTGQVDLGSNETFTTLGIYNISCSILESQNYTGETEWYLVTVSDTTNPGIVLVSPSNSTETVNTSINFTANVSDNYNLSNATLYLYNSTDDLINQTTVDISGTQSLVGIVVSLIDGIYNWFFDVFDTSGNSNSTVNWTLTQDDTEPIFGAIANQSVAYLVNVTYDIDATDNLIGLDTFAINDTGNFAINSTGYITNATPLGVGVYWVNISVNDTLGNENSSIMNFNITQIAGNVTLTINDTATNVTIPYDESVNINCSYETGEVNTTLYQNGTEITTGQTDLGYVFSNITLGDYNISCVLPESQNYTGETEWYILTVEDPSVPTTTLVSPSNNTVNPTGDINFTCNASVDGNLTLMEFYINEVLNQSESITGIENESTFTVNDLVNADYNWTCISYTIGNNDSADEYLFTVNSNAIPVIDGFDGSTTNYSLEEDLTNVATPRVENTSYGYVEWYSTLNTSYNNYTESIIFEYNLISINTSVLNVGFNSTALLKLYNLTNDYLPILLRNGEICDSTCTRVNYSNGVLSFNVSAFSNYTSTNNSALAISYTGNATSSPTYFYANYTNYTSGDAITNASCNLSVNGTDLTMDWNATSELYEANNTFTIEDNYTYQINCSATNFENATLIDFANITLQNNTVYWVENISAVTLTALTTTSVSVLFNATGSDLTSECEATKSGETTRTLTCVEVVNSSNDFQFNCTGDFYYYDAAGSDWNINCSVDNTYNNSINFTVNSLEYISQDNDTFVWSEAYANTNDQEADDPIILTNGGNTNYTELNITAYDSLSGNNSISASSIAISAISGNPAGTSLSNDTAVEIGWFSLPKGSGSTEYLYAYLDLGDVEEGTYTSSDPWIIQVE